MAYEHILAENRNGVLVIAINREAKMNALNIGLLQEIKTEVEAAQQDDSVKGIIITGSGTESFAAVADIADFSEFSVMEGTQMSASGHEVMNTIEISGKLVIGAINGFALGGGCMACHMRIASSTAKFGQPEVNLGLVPGYGGSQRLVKLAGKGKALEMLLTGAMIDAQEAWRTGIVNHVTEPGNEVAKSFEILGIIAKKAPLAVAGCISLVNDYYIPTVNGYQEEYNLFGKLITTDDAREGAAAFVEKRTAEFKAQ